MKASEVSEVVVGRAFIFKPSWDRYKNLTIHDRVHSLTAKHGFFRVESFTDETLTATFPVHVKDIENFGVTIVKNGGSFRYTFDRARFKKAEMVFIIPLAELAD